MARSAFLVMPEWQGSPSSRAMQLADGAAILSEDLPRSASREVPVPLEAGDSMGTPVARLSSLLQARGAALSVLAESRAAGETPIVVGGDDATSLPGLEASVRTHGSESLAVLWFDAHPELEHPSTSASGSASGMTLRHALGEGAPDLRSETPIDATRVAMVGVRAMTPDEAAELDRLGITQIDPEQIDPAQTDPEQTDPEQLDPEQLDPDRLADAVRQWLRSSGASHVFVHIDLDVLDPAEFTSVHRPEPFGLSAAELTSAVRAAVGELPLIGATICEFAPADESAASDDLPTVLRIIGALTSGRGRVE